MLGPRNTARNSRIKPDTPDKRTQVILWFLYPEINAYKLTGTTNINNSWCTSKLFNDIARNPELKIKNDGTKRQCRAHTKDSAIANLSEFNWVFMVFLEIWFYWRCSPTASDTWDALKHINEMLILFSTNYHEVCADL